MKRAYLYPVTARYQSEIVNPYMEDFQHFLGKEFEFVNQNYPSNNGILDLLKYYFKVKYIFLHWPENIPDRKFGVIQSIFLLTILIVSRILNKKVVWTMHNRISNKRTHLFFKKILFSSLVRNSSHIITHASDGCTIASQLSPKYARKTIVVPHPVKIQDNLPEGMITKELDVLIWGTIVEYKGIDKFLEYLKSNSMADTFKLVIAGKVLEKSYYERIHKLLGENTELINQYLDKDKLINLAIKSRIVLFPYSPEGVLSSGALMDSLSWGATILGPDVGAFRDCAEKHIIFTYSGYEDLVYKMKQILKGTLKIEKAALKSFTEENTWENFTRKILAFIG